MQKPQYNQYTEIVNNNLCIFQAHLCSWYERYVLTSTQVELQVVLILLRSHAEQSMLLSLHGGSKNTQSLRTHPYVC